MNNENQNNPHQIEYNPKHGLSSIHTTSSSLLYTNNEHLTKQHNKETFGMTLNYPIQNYKS